jgi:hypothetical protein
LGLASLAQRLAALEQQVTAAQARSERLDAPFLERLYAELEESVNVGRAALAQALQVLDLTQASGQPRQSRQPGQSVQAAAQTKPAPAPTDLAGPPAQSPPAVAVCLEALIELERQLLTGDMAALAACEALDQRVKFSFEQTPAPWPLIVESVLRLDFAGAGLLCAELKTTWAEPPPTAVD